MVALQKKQTPFGIASRYVEDKSKFLICNSEKEQRVKE